MAITSPSHGTITTATPAINCAKNPTDTLSSLPLNLVSNHWFTSLHALRASTDDVSRCCPDTPHFTKIYLSELKAKKSKFGLFNLNLTRKKTNPDVSGSCNLKLSESLLRKDPLFLTTSDSSTATYRYSDSSLLPDHPDRPAKSLRDLLFSPKASSESNFANYQFEESPRVIYRSKSLRLEANPVSKNFPNTATNWGLPRKPAGYSGHPDKMHQTSSRLLRMTTDDRPFTRDFKDLFATLVVSLPLASHRVRLSRIDHSFLSEEAINNLGSLKFSQSNRMPVPKDSSRIVTTTTTTTFSMAREMARSVCQRFLDARFIESADGKHSKDFPTKGALWQLTPKGIHVLERFCGKNGIQQKNVTDIINSPRNTMQLVILERDVGSDKLSSDRSTIEVIFRRFVGQNGPNIKPHSNNSDSDSLHEYKDSLAGVRMTGERRIGSRTFSQTFTGRAATDWLLECCTTVDRLEATEIATLFLAHGLMMCVHIDRQYLAQFGGSKREKASIFQPTKNAIYQLTSKGKDVVDMKHRDYIPEGELSGSPSKLGVSRDSNTQKLEKILNDAALRLLFRENLRDTHCEENFSFYLDVEEFIKSCQLAIKSHSNSSKKGSSSPVCLDSIKETMASAYGIYNAFLAPGSPNELNIDHMLRNQLATRMTKAVGQDGAMVESLEEVTKLFQEAQNSVFKLMASDSVPKFMKNPKYEQTLKNYDFDSIPHKHVTEREKNSSSR
ncbi:Developmental regulator flbA [Golovinomyces cichoracearum]|uniref:Developmental regulator flbA n=1 Tax=Golovinomyces cichoracearum TaxID=62708 RepID=A0A420I699_9PEZI|nr:Developmental regulator flbA [Golovinomyces cichoracearum]